MVCPLRAYDLLPKATRPWFCLHLLDRILLGPSCHTAYDVSVRDHSPTLGEAHGVHFRHLHRDLQRDHHLDHSLLDDVLQRLHRR